MRWLSVGLLVGVMIFGVSILVHAAVTPALDVMPLYARTGENDTPFVVFLRVTGLDEGGVYDFTARINQDGTDRGSFTTSGSFSTSYKALGIAGADGVLTRWVSIRASNTVVVGACNIRIRIRKGGSAVSGSPWDFSGPEMMDMVNSGAWIYDDDSRAPDGYAVLAFNGDGNIIGAYAAENNGVDEEYSLTSGYVKMAVPASTTIAKFEARTSTNTVYATDTTPGDWESGSVGTTKDIEINEGDLTLPVTLSSFTALPGDGQIILRWITESEIDNLGFNVYRSLEEDGKYVRINGDRIQGAGSSAMRSEYSFTDVRLTNGRTYFYKLEDVSFDGKHTLHGPIKAIPKAAVKGEEKTSGEEWPKRSHWGKVKHSLKSGDEKDE